MRRRKAAILAQGRRRTALLIRTFAVGALLGAWAIVSWLELVAPRFLPTPWRVVEAAIDLKPSIFVHALYTLGLVLVGLPTGALAALYVGIWMRRSFIARHMLTPVIESWRPVPPVAIVPFFIIWFGFAWHGKLLLVALGAFLIVVVGVVESIDRIDPLHIRTALSFGASSATLVDHVVLPAIGLTLLAPLRIALALSITLAVVADFMGATRGLGHVMHVASNTFATHTVLLCAVVLGVIGGVLDLVLRKLHERMTPWARTAREAVEYGRTLERS